MVLDAQPTAIDVVKLGLNKGEGGWPETQPRITGH
jgi:hypothetical protein